MSKTKNKNLIYREAVIEPISDWAAGNREVKVAFASEMPVERWDGIEVLSCVPADVDLSRLNNGASVLENHDPEERIGGVLTAVVDTDHICRALIKIRQECAVEFGQDLEDKIPPKVSVGYIRTKIVKQEKIEGGLMRNTWAWMPYEISFVSIPADDTVGIGRAMLESKEDNLAGVAVVAQEANNNTRQEEKNMNESKEVVAPVGQTAEQVRMEAAEIVKIGRQHKMEALSDKALDCGMSVDNFRKQVMEELAKRGETPKVDAKAEIGLNQKEIQQYSFRKMILSQIPNSGVTAEFERECSDAAAKINRTSPKGIIVPFDVMLGRRDLAVSGTGSNVVATNLLSGSFIDALRAKALLSSLGCQYLMGLTGDIAIPKLSAKSTAYWIDTEGNAPTESTPAFAQLPGTPHTVGTYVDVTRKLLKQSSMDVESLLRNDLANVLAVAIDVAGIDGAGASGEPSGLYNHATDVAVTAGTPTWAELLNMIAGIDTANAGIDGLKWALTPAVMAKCTATAQNGAGSAVALDMANRTMAGYPVISSSSVKAKYGFLGNWSNLIVAMWGGLDVLVDPYSASNTGTVRINAFQDVDIICRHPTAFSMADILS